MILIVAMAFVVIMIIIIVIVIIIIVVVIIIIIVIIIIVVVFLLLLFLIIVLQEGNPHLQSAYYSYVFDKAYSKVCFDYYLRNLPSYRCDQFLVPRALAIVTLKYLK